MSNRRDYERLIRSWGLRYFSPEEIMCMGASHDSPSSSAHGLNTLPPRELWGNMEATAHMADAAREILGVPVRVLSAYRSPAYNKAVGGAPLSWHKRNCALDLAPTGKVSAARLHAALTALRLAGYFRGGLGRYPSFVHVDTRGRNADW